jgi:hypothetical protein
LSAVVRLLLAVIMGGMAAWFTRSHTERGEPGYWFLALLLTASVCALLGAVALWVGDDTISQSFWIARCATLSLSIFLVFCFARSFNSTTNYTLLFWALPFLLDLSIIIVDIQHIYNRSGRDWMINTPNALSYIHLAIAVFYAAVSFYFWYMVYSALKAHEDRKKSVRISYMLAGLLIIFASQVAVAPLRAYLSSASPIVEAGSLLGAFLLWLGIAEPRAILIERKKRRPA